MEGMAALSEENLSLRGRQGVLFRFPGSQGRGCWQERLVVVFQGLEKGLCHPDVL